jgi:hypothetical protein
MQKSIMLLKLPFTATTIKKYLRFTGREQRKNLFLFETITLHCLCGNSEKIIIQLLISLLIYYAPNLYF